MEPVRQSLGGCVHPQDRHYLTMGLYRCGQPSCPAVRTSCTPTVRTTYGTQTWLWIECTALRRMPCYVGEMCTTREHVWSRPGSDCQPHTWKTRWTGTPRLGLQVYTHFTDLQPGVWTLSFQHRFDTIPIAIRYVGRPAAAGTGCHEQPCVTLSLYRRVCQRHGYSLPSKQHGHAWGYPVCRNAHCFKDLSSRPQRGAEYHTLSGGLHWSQKHCVFLQGARDKV